MAKFIVTKPLMVSIVVHADSVEDAAQQALICPHDEGEADDSQPSLDFDELNIDLLDGECLYADNIGAFEPGRCPCYECCKQTQHWGDETEEE